MNKNKKNSEPDLSSAPAFGVFCDPVNNPEPYEYISWGLVIRQLRDSTNLDRALFGRLIGGYSMQQIGRYEKEQTEPPIDFWLKMMKKFGLNITWAMSGHGNPCIAGFDESDERKKFLTWIFKAAEKDDFLRELKGD
jgi:hypothetical protein